MRFNIWYKPKNNNYGNQTTNSCLGNFISG